MALTRRQRQMREALAREKQRAIERLNPPPPQPRQRQNDPDAQIISRWQNTTFSAITQKFREEYDLEISHRVPDPLSVLPEPKGEPDWRNMIFGEQLTLEGNDGKKLDKAFDQWIHGIWKGRDKFFKILGTYGIRHVDFDWVAFSNAYKSLKG